MKLHPCGYVILLIPILVAPVFGQVGLDYGHSQHDPSTLTEVDRPQRLPRLAFDSFTMPSDVVRAEGHQMRRPRGWRQP